MAGIGSSRIRGLVCALAGCDCRRFGRNRSGRSSSRRRMSRFAAATRQSITVGAWRPLIVIYILAPARENWGGRVERSKQERSWALEVRKIAPQTSRHLMANTTILLLIRLLLPQRYYYCSCCYRLRYCWCGCATSYGPNGSWRLPDFKKYMAEIPFSPGDFPQSHAAPSPVA